MTKYKMEITKDIKCRTCLSKDSLRSIFDEVSLETDRLSLSEMLMECTAVKISKNDVLPNKICKNCTNNLKDAYKFKKNCEATDFSLRLQSTMLQSSQEAADFHDDVTKPERDLKCEGGNSPSVSNGCDDTYETDRSHDNKKHSTGEKNKRKTSNRNLHFVCEYCSKLYRSRSAFFSHLHRMHSESEKKPNEFPNQKNNYFYDAKHNVYVCSICRRGFSSEHVVMEHYFRHGTERKCHKCGDSFDTSSDLLKHRRSQHGEKISECKECGKCFVKNWSLKVHSIVHSGAKPFSCESCGLRFGLIGNLNRHARLHKGIRPYKCHVCSKSFSVGSKLADHIDKQHGDGGTPSACDRCGKLFNSIYSLRSHVHNKHDIRSDWPRTTDSRKYLCSECGKSYSTKGNLKLHSNTHSGVKRYRCDVCDKGFYKKANLDIHLNRHNNVKPFQCSTCGKAFSQLGGLKIHTLSHTGEKPFKCEVCERAFTQSQHVVRHMRTHTGEKPYSCSVCGRNFSIKKNLDVHFRIHTGETPYKCSVCQKGFKCSNNMKKHQKVHADKKIM